MISSLDLLSNDVRDPFLHKGHKSLVLIKEARVSRLSFVFYIRRGQMAKKKDFAEMVRLQLRYPEPLV